MTQRRIYGVNHHADTGQLLQIKVFPTIDLSSHCKGLSSIIETGRGRPGGSSSHGGVQSSANPLF